MALLERFDLAAALPAVWCAPGKSDEVAVTNFRADVRRELRKLKVVWPELDYHTPRGALELRPTPPRIPAGTSTEAG